MPKVEYKNIAPLKSDEHGFKSVGDIGYVDDEGYLYFKELTKRHDRNRW
ncbi:MAG: hypothetical protein V8R43_08205 [Dorea sp.]